jgi:pimeloyl-ACP methyl ester carboxylesterase
LNNPADRSQQWLPRISWQLLFGMAACVSPALAGAAAPAIRDVAEAGASFRCDQVTRAGDHVVIIETSLAGVPAVLRVPRHVSRPPIVLWHGFGPPASARALMEALPLDRMPAIKVYLDLPLFGARAPAGGNKELVRRQSQDFAMLLFKPTAVGAADELPSVVAALERHGCMARGQRIGLFGFSAGGAAALVALIQGKVAVSAAVLVNASTGLQASVAALHRAMKQPYAWTPASRALAYDTDAVRHAAAIARGNPPTALLIVQGDSDTVLTSEPARALHAVLLPYYHAARSDARLGFVLVPGMTHNWVDSRTSTARLRRETATWFVRYQ